MRLPTSDEYQGLRVQKPASEYREWKTLLQQIAKVEINTCKKLFKFSCFYLFWLGAANPIVYVCGCICFFYMCACMYVGGAVRRQLLSQFSPIMWIPKTKLRLSILSNNVVSCVVILKASNKMRTKLVFYFNVLAIWEIKPDLHMIGKLFTSEL